MLWVTLTSAVPRFGDAGIAKQGGGGGPGGGSSPGRSGGAVFGALLFGLFSNWLADGSHVGFGPFLARSVLRTLVFSSESLGPFGGLGIRLPGLLSLWLQFGAHSGSLFLA